jgi:hypothetical protein
MQATIRRTNPATPQPMARRAVRVSEHSAEPAVEDLAKPQPPQADGLVAYFRLRKVPAGQGIGAPEDSGQKLPAGQALAS